MLVIRKNRQKGRRPLFGGLGSDLFIQPCRVQSIQQRRECAALSDTNLQFEGIPIGAVGNAVLTGFVHCLNLLRARPPEQPLLALQDQAQSDSTGQMHG